VWLPERGASQIRLAWLDDGTVTDVTPAPFDDTSPAFTLDGKYLAFLSTCVADGFTRVSCAKLRLRGQV
jgi:tricorn protease